MDPERIYSRLPRVLQTAALNIEGWRVNRMRFGAGFDRLLRESEARSLVSGNDIVEFRDRRLAAFVAQAAEEVPFYRARFRAAGVDPRSIRTLDDLRALPVLRKQDVQDRLQALRPDGFRGDTLTCHTSGTTGGGLRFPVSIDGHREQWATWWRYRQWHGIRPQTHCATFGGRSVVPIDQKTPPFWRTNHAGSQTLFSAYHLRESTARFYLDEIERSKATWLHGYPSFIALLGSFAISLNRRLSVTAVTLGAESLLPSQARIIGEAFGVAPVEHYGMAEGIANISQCPRGKLHVDEDFAATEFIPVGGDQYSIVGTNLSNPAFPLIRYEVGDLATMSKATCDCGRPGRIVDRIDGRQEDYVITRSGSRLSRLDHIFKDMVHIREAQIQQSARGAVTIAVVRGPGYDSAARSQLTSEVARRFGQDVTFEIVYREALTRTKSGKLRLVVSTMEDGQLNSVQRAHPGHR